ncbi:hypothetical protein HPC62_20745 [Thermoleptolyngbya sichuanensis A183]|uniref:Uncharacterized protein n=1 Tax=Thermoleptolyngbya sichuanensis A183 TaxID=2737172 RepID=A0A6M8BA97_9CYAN|nr:hypothetical protein [Thermoleptolyngbya sichuanensis]QKD84279.1 hypothetical protein HPC62_20745 [Thermoleptolyngbya sichuanensis A183]
MCQAKEDLCQYHLLCDKGRHYESDSGYNQRNLGQMYHLIRTINRLSATPPEKSRPEQK